MNKSGPQIVFLEVENHAEDAFNKSNKIIQRSLMASHAKFEATWTSRHYGFQKWLAIKCDTMDICMTIFSVCMNDQNVSVCSNTEYYYGSKLSLKMTVRELLRALPTINGVKPKGFITEEGRLALSAEEGDGFLDYYGEFHDGYPFIHPDLVMWAKRYDSCFEWDDPGSVTLCDE